MARFMRYYSNLCWGLIAYLFSFVGTLLLASAPARPWAMLLLIGAAVLAVLIWGRQEWIPAFTPRPITQTTASWRSRSFYLFGVQGALLIALTGDFCYFASPNETFGLAGILWLVSIGLLLGAATVLPLYGLIRGTWGRYAAIAGTAILAFSASNIHYSRLALNNITTEFFWAACFFFLIRSLRLRRPLDCALAGLSVGLSEYFYYGTRLLPFVVLLFICYI